MDQTSQFSDGVDDDTDDSKSTNGSNTEEDDDVANEMDHMDEVAVNEGLF